jgi:hypothetical protein
MDAFSTRRPVLIDSADPDTARLNEFPSLAKVKGLVTVRMCALAQIPTPKVVNMKVV